MSALTYSLIANSTSVLRSDGATIPNDPENTDWRVYQAWLAAGGVPTAAPAPPAAPITVQMWQAEAVLKGAAYVSTQATTPTAQTATASATNLWDATTALVAAQGNASLTAFLERSSIITSNDPTLGSLAAALGVSEPQILALFTQASALTL